MSAPPFARELPTGTVTFLFTDIEGSTRMLEELGPEGYEKALTEHRRLLRDVFSRHGGVEVDTQGDAFFVAFAEARAAVATAHEAQHVLADGRIRVRMGLHTGNPHVGLEGYVGHDVHLGARIAAAGHGGQVLVSRATRDAVGAAFELLDLGEHRVKDFAEPVWIYQLGTVERFPPLKTISNTNLPRPASSFVGREGEVADISALLRNGSRLLTLTGPGGTGKTRLSIEAATELVPHFKNGVFWVELATVRDPELVLPAIATTVGAKDDLVDHIGERQLLLVLDNLEQVVAAAPQIGQLVATCRNLRVLATSRERLRVRDEVEYTVPPLSLPDAVELFTIRSGLPGDSTVTALCERLDRLPLAIEVAAARTTVMSPAQVLQRLSKRLDLLKGGRDAERRQQTLRATIEWSYDLLDADERRLFARLATFAGGWTLEAAESIADADLDVLQSLVDKSLVQHDGERFTMLESIREYALERLVASGEADAVRGRHAEYFLALAEAAELPLDSPDRDAWCDLLERDHENLRAAMDRFESRGIFQSSMRLAGSILEFWDERAHHAEATRRYTRLVESDLTPTVPRAKVLDGAAHMTTLTGDIGKAVPLEEEALRLFRTFNDERGITQAMWGLGYMAVETGDYAKAEPILNEVVERLARAGNETVLAWATRTLAFCYEELGNHERSRELHEQNLARARRLGDEALQAAELSALSSVALEGGRRRDAAAFTRESLQLVGSMRDRMMALSRLCAAADILTSLGNSVVAAHLLGFAESRLEEIGAREPWVERMNKRTVARIHGAIDAAAFAEAWAAGQALTDEAAVALGITALDGVVEQLSGQ